MPVTFLAISSKAFSVKAAELTTFGAEVVRGRIRHVELQPKSIGCSQHRVASLAHGKTGLAAAASTMAGRNVGCFGTLEWDTALQEQSLLQHAKMSAALDTKRRQLARRRE